MAFIEEVCCKEPESSEGELSFEIASSSAWAGSVWIGSGESTEGKNGSDVAGGEKKYPRCPILHRRTGPGFSYELKEGQRFGCHINGGSSQKAYVFCAACLAGLAPKFSVGFYLIFVERAIGPFACRYLIFVGLIVEPAGR